MSFWYPQILPKKNEKIRPNGTLIPQVEFFRSFFGRIEDTKTYFEINRPLVI